MAWAQLINDLDFRPSTKQLLKMLFARLLRKSKRIHLTVSLRVANGSPAEPDSVRIWGTQVEMSVIDDLAVVATTEQEKQHEAFHS